MSDSGDFEFGCLLSLMVSLAESTFRQMETIREELKVKVTVKLIGERQCVSVRLGDYLTSGCIHRQGGQPSPAL